MAAVTSAMESSYSGRDPMGPRVALYNSSRRSSLGAFGDTAPCLTDLMVPR